MRRVAVLLLLGAVLIAATWRLAPAAPNPAATRARPALDQAGSVVADVNAQIEQLRRRLNTQTPLPPPTRNPFEFGSVERPRPSLPSPSAAPTPAPADVMPALPRLVAITSRTTDQGPVRAAVFAIGDDQVIVRVGETIGAFRVRAVDDDAVEVAYEKTGASFRIR